MNTPLTSASNNIRMTTVIPREATKATVAEAADNKAGEEKME